MKQQILELLFNEVAILPTENSFYQNILAIINEESIHSQVYFLLKQQGRFDILPADFQKQLILKYQESLYLNIFIKNQIDKILHSFESEGIDVIPLKGTYFAERFFGHIGARATSDIDLLIRFTDLEQAIKLVNSLGFNKENKKILNHFHLSFSKELSGSNLSLTVELHWNFLREDTAELYIDEVWAEATPIKSSSSTIQVLSNYHSFYFTCIHGWRHNMDSLKYFIDIIQLIISNQEVLDYSILLSDASRHQTKTRVIRTLAVVYQKYPQLHSILEFPWKVTLFYDDSNEKHKRSIKKYLDFIDYSFFSYDTAKHRIREMIYLIKK